MPPFPESMTPAGSLMTSASRAHAAAAARAAALAFTPIPTASSPSGGPPKQPLASRQPPGSRSADAGVASCEKTLADGRCRRQALKAPGAAPHVP